MNILRQSSVNFIVTKDELKRALMALYPQEFLLHSIDWRVATISVDKSSSAISINGHSKQMECGEIDANRCQREISDAF